MENRVIQTQSIMAPRRERRVKIIGRPRLRLALLLCGLSTPFAFGGIELACASHTPLKLLVAVVFIVPTVVTGLMSAAFRIWERPRGMELNQWREAPVIWSK